MPRVAVYLYWLWMVESWKNRVVHRTCYPSLKPGLVAFPSWQVNGSHFFRKASPAALATGSGPGAKLTASATCSPFCMTVCITTCNKDCWRPDFRKTLSVIGWTRSPQNVMNEPLSRNHMCFSFSLAALKSHSKSAAFFLRQVYPIPEFLQKHSVSSRPGDSASNIFQNNIMQHNLSEPTKHTVWQLWHTLPKVHGAGLQNQRCLAPRVKTMALFKSIASNIPYNILQHYSVNKHIVNKQYFFVIGVLEVLWSYCLFFFFWFCHVDDFGMVLEIPESTFLTL